MATDPVCKMEIPEGDITAEYNGETYYFCSDTCQEEFMKNPKKYIK
ncbi:YHS domain-containing protein [archaeon]|nr:MAG: YHS domain-containing protein [archaeon]